MDETLIEVLEYMREQMRLYKIAQLKKYNTSYINNTKGRCYKPNGSFQMPQSVSEAKKSVFVSAEYLYLLIFKAARTTFL